MGRSLAGVVSGYVVMFVAVMTTLSVAFVAMGADRAFEPGTFEVTALWVLVSAVSSFGAAILGGYVAARIGRGPRVAVLLAVVVVILGVILAIPALDAPEPGRPRTGEVGNAEAMMNAQQPPFVSFLNPVIGAVGVMIGGRLRKARAAS